MPNPLTGDFEGVLQVSGSTLNRLLSSMHQNAFANPKLPSFPHSIRMRIGDDRAYQGVRGLVHAQVGVPRIELIHGATDRFILEVGIRAWYRPDPGTEPLADFINGTVRAEYRIHDIDPACLGWAKKAGQFLWIRVVRSSVRFQGTAENDTSMVQLVVTAPPPDPATTLAKITRQIAFQLARRFAPAPHPVSDRFRRGAMRSLSAPIGGSAVALPLALTAHPPSGQIQSIDNVLLGGHDLAVAVSIDYIMALMAPALNALRTFTTTVPVPENDPDPFTVYHVGVHPPSVKWIPYGSHAVFEIKVSGWANTNSILANATFDVTQNITLSFDDGLTLSPWSPGVKVKAKGLGAADYDLDLGVVDLGSEGVATRVKKALLATIPAMVGAACNGAQASLEKIAQETEGLKTQLQSLDALASVGWDSAEFVVDGVVMRGTIGVAPRRPVVVLQEKTPDGNAHSAIESWIPGGRIDRLEWSWTWSGTGSSGKATFTDRFLLRRPWQGTSRWGMVVGAIGTRTALPGLDGWGSVCLRITGARVDPVTGQFVTVISTRRCTHFGFTAAQLFTENERLLLRDMPELSQDVRFPQLKERPVVATRRGGGVANTLLVYVDEAWTGETADTLGRALDGCRRYDAGLAVLVLFREGVLDASGGRPIEEIERFTSRLGIAAHVNEDVNGGWARSLALRAGSSEPAWAIITPEGLAAWTHPGRIDPKILATALDTHLRRCADLRPGAYRSAVQVGSVVTGVVLQPEFIDLIEAEDSPCPPIPLEHWGVETRVTFVQNGSGASAAHLRSLADDHGQENAAVVVVVDRADARAVESLKSALGLDFLVIPDPAGKITDRFGVDVWPTTITLDRQGIVSAVDVGLRARAGGEIERDEEPDQPGKDRRPRDAV